MSVNLMDMVKQAATKQVLGKIGGLLGMDEGKTQGAFDMASGSILGGLMKKAGTADGAREIFGAVQKTDDSMLDKLGDLLGGGDATEQYQKQGSGILDMVMGNSQGGMLSAIAKQLGIGEGIVGKLLSMAAPMIMAVIGRYAKSKALDAVGLGNLLGSQKTHLASALPASLTSGLGFGNLLGNAGDAVGNVAGSVGNVASSVGNAASGAASDAGRAVSGAAGDAANAGGGLIKMLLPLLLLGALLWGLWQFVLSPMMNGANPAGDIAGAVTDGAGDLAAKAGDLANFEMPNFGALEGVDMSALPGDTGATLSNGFGEIATGLQGLKDEAGAQDLVGKIGGFTEKVNGLGLGDLSGPAKAASDGLIGQFVTVVKSLLGGQSAGIQGILQPAIDALMKALGQ